MKVITLRKEASPLQFKAEATGAGSLSLEIYDVIGADIFGEGITSSAVSAAVNSAAFDSITVHLNSPGGDLFEGVAIYNILKNYGKPVNVVVDGLAASAASLIAMSGDSITMGEGSMMMIHNAMSMTFGNGDDLRAMADTLDTVSASAADLYVSRTGMKKSDVLDMMSAETWMSAKDAVKYGFADEVQGKGKYTNAFDLSGFKNTPEELKAVAVVEPPERPVVTEPEIKAEEQQDETYKVSLMQKRLEIEKRK
jgi:ATP-dependent Clp protease protease subunit